MSEPNADYAPLLKSIEDEVKREWGSAFVKLGDRIQRALLAEAILLWANRQDDEVSNERIREILWAGQQWAWMETGY